SNRSLAASDATMLVVAAALFGVFFFCTLYMQQVLGYNALKTGVAYLPWTLTTITASTLASRVVDRFTPKPVLVRGLLLATAGSPLPVALTHGFKGAFIVAAALCAIGGVMALVLLPARPRRPEDEQTETLALSFARCPGAPSCGHLAARARATLGR